MMQAETKQGPISGRSRGQSFRDRKKQEGFVYVTMWVHASDAEAVRAYGVRKNSQRFRGKIPAAGPSSMTGDPTPRSRTR